MSLAPFSAPYSPSDRDAVAGLLKAAESFAVDDGAVKARARHYIESIRSRAGGIGAVEDFMREFGLSTR